MKRCPWSTTEQIYIDYHDTEWGVPVYDSKALFAKLILDGFQAGLSWITILKKRDNFYKAFDNFDPEIISEYDQAKIDNLLKDKGIVRNKLKVNATITNAKAFIEYEKNTRSFSDFLWSFVDGRPAINQWETMEDVPATSKESDAMSKALKKLGFKFTGSTICYAFMQAVGMVNDHLETCFRYEDLKNNKPFLTKRLIIRPTTISDSPFIFELLNTPKWIKNIGDRNINSIKDAEVYIKTKMLPQLKKLGYSTYTVIRKSDGIKAGTCGLYDREGVDGIDIGFAFLPQFEKKGYAFESVGKLKELAIHDFKIPQISAITIKENKASQNLLEKLGLKFEKTVNLPNDDAELLLYKSVNN
jgi:DNA-3-methyladenine glycosylase I